MSLPLTPTFSGSTTRSGPRSRLTVRGRGHSAAAAAGHSAAAAGDSVATAGDSAAAAGDSATAGGGHSAATAAAAAAGDAAAAAAGRAGHSNEHGGGRWRTTRCLDAAHCARPEGQVQRAGSKGVGTEEGPRGQTLGPESSRQPAQDRGDGHPLRAIPVLGWPCSHWLHWRTEAHARVRTEVLAELLADGCHCASEPHCVGQREPSGFTCCQACGEDILPRQGSPRRRRSVLQAGQGRAALCWCGSLDARRQVPRLPPVCTGGQRGHAEVPPRALLLRVPLWLLRAVWPQGRVAAERGASPRSVRQEGLLHRGCH
mmetsp:Transcript_5915/g.23302  ORF Transcript_5915/g.23302 Transcript_5915/m.23302 type:complete len:315 (-) Transcript_5915:45-989(-)